MSYKAENLPQDKHIFLGRQGGVSSGKYASLNIRARSLDRPENIAQNRKIAAQKLGLEPKQVMILCQSASTDVVEVDTASQDQIKADGMVCTTPGIALSIGTADCLPILLADYKHGVIGAAHAGWRGAVRGVIENTVRLMLQKGAVLNDIAAALGPCIQQKSFEVGAEVRAECVSISADYAHFFASGKDPEHFWFDLEGLSRHRLEQLGITNITASGIDTYTDEENYFSFRRDTHQGNVTAPRDFGGHISLIKL